MNLRAGQEGLVKALTGPVVGLFAAPVLLGAVLTLLNVGPVIELTSAAVAFGAVSLFHTFRARRLNRTFSAPPDDDLNSVELASVTTLIATANVDNGPNQAVGTLISKLPNLQEVHVIVGPPCTWGSARMANPIRRWHHRGGHRDAGGTGPVRHHHGGIHLVDVRHAPRSTRPGESAGRAD